LKTFYFYLPKFDDLFSLSQTAFMPNFLPLYLFYSFFLRFTSVSSFTVSFFCQGGSNSIAKTGGVPWTNKPPGSATALERLVYINDEVAKRRMSAVASLAMVYWEREPQLKFWNFFKRDVIIDCWSEISQQFIDGAIALYSSVDFLRKFRNLPKKNM